LIDANGNVTTQGAVFFGDYFGKSTNQLTALSPTGTPGLDILSTVTGISSQNPNVVALAGNWEPRYAYAMAAQAQGYTGVVQDLAKKTVNLKELNYMMNNSSGVQRQMSQLSFVSYVPGTNTVAQHIDTAELARLSLSEADLGRLMQTDMPLAQRYLQIETKPGTINSEDLAVIQQAVNKAGVSSQQVVANINSNANTIINNAVGQASRGHVPAGAAFNDIQNLNNIMGQELTFYNSGNSDLLTRYSQLLGGADSIIHGHSPISSMTSYAKYDLKPQFIEGGYSGSYYDQASGVHLQNVDFNNSRGMRLPLTNPDHPMGFWPVVNGEIQIPDEIWNQIAQ
jgi:hypothetical protein